MLVLNLYFTRGQGLLELIMFEFRALNVSSFKHLKEKIRHWRKEKLGPILIASIQVFKRGKGLLAGNFTCAGVCRIGALEKAIFYQLLFASVEVCG